MPQSVRLLALAPIAAVLLGACNPAPAPESKARDQVDAAAAESTAAPLAPGQAAETVPHQSAPQATPGLDWYTRGDMEGGQPTMRLAFEAPDTDHQPLGMDCLKGSRVVTIDHQSSGTGLNSLTLASEGARQSYPVRAEAQEEMGGGEFLTTAEIPITDPVLVAFKRTGWLTLTVDGATTGMASQPNGGAKELIHDFFEFCAADE